MLVERLQQAELRDRERRQHLLLVDPHPPGVQVQGPDDGQWLLRADRQADLLDALAAVERPAADLRLWVDPLRVR